MTRIAVAIVITLIAFGALIVLAGRTDWNDVSYRVSSGAIDAIDALTPDQPISDEDLAARRTITDAATWNRDFMRDARSSATCPTDTVQHVRMRMAAVGPYTAAEFERTVAEYLITDDEPRPPVPSYNRVSELVRREITATDQIYLFRYDFVRADFSAWRLSGYFVARDECIVHVEVTD